MIFHYIKLECGHAPFGRLTPSSAAILERSGKIVRQQRFVSAYFHVQLLDDPPRNLVILQANHACDTQV